MSNYSAYLVSARTGRKLPAIPGTEIVEVCYGIKSKRSKNALHFQKLVSQLFSWLFIDELCPLNLNKIENLRKQRRDAAFRVLDTFNTELRCDYKFYHLFIECKNYENPSHKDVMQVFSYTIFYNASEIFKIPLSLIVSRKNPEEKSYAIDYCNKIYHKRIADNETRIILFFDINDLEEMVKKKIEDGDPAFKIKSKIVEFSDKYIGFGG